LATIAFLAMIVLFQATIPPLAHASTGAVTVASGVPGGKASINDQDKLFYDSASNLWWVFYSDGSAMQCTSSGDRIAWAPPTEINSSVTAGLMFSLWHNDSAGTIYYVSSSGGDYFHFRYGVLSSSGCGGIEWSTGIGGVRGTYGNAIRPTISVVDANDILISVSEFAKPYYYVEVFLCRGTSCESVHSAKPTTVGNYESIIMSVGSSQDGQFNAVLLYAVDGTYNGSTITFDYTTDGGRTWNLSAFTTDNVYWGNRMSAYNIGKTVYVAAVEFNPNNVCFFHYTLGGSGSPETPVAAGANRNVGLAFDNETGFVIGYTDATTVSYVSSANLGGNWTRHTDLFTGEPTIYEAVLNVERGPDATFGMIWTVGTGPYAVRFGSFSPPLAHPTSTSVSCSPTSLAVGNSTTCTATVTDNSSNSSAPAGTISFSTTPSGAGSFVPAFCTLRGSGSTAACAASFTPASGTERSIDVNGTYSGDSIHTGSSGAASVTATKRDASIIVSCTPSSLPVTLGAVCSATVMDTSPGTQVTPSGGNVTFADSPSGSGVFFPISAQCTANSGACAVTFTPSSGRSGTIMITASYAGDTDHLSSSATAEFTLKATKVATVTAVACSPSTSQINQESVCTATVSDSGGATERPTGNVTFDANPSAGGSLSPSSCKLSGGMCSVTFIPAATGDITIQGSYGSDPDHSSSVGTSTFTATSRTSSISVSCTPSSLQVTRETTCTATVTDSSTGVEIMPTGGTVTFTDSPAESGLFTPASGQCTTNFGKCAVTFSPSKIGNISIAASYVGDADHSSSSSSAGFALSSTEPTPAFVFLLLSLDIISSIVAYPISYYSFKFNKLVGSPALKAISVGFALLGTGLLVEGLTTFIADATVVNGLLAKSLVADAGLLFLTLQLVAYFTFAWGYAIEVFGSSRETIDSLKQTGTLLPVAILTSTFGAYYDLALLAYLLMVALLAFIVFEAVLVYGRSRRKSALLVLLGFGVLFGSHVLMLASVAALTQITFYEGTLAQFIGFIILLWFLVRSGRFVSS